MKRKIYSALLEWKNREDKKPLILQGARQIGKTYLVSMFGESEYKNVVYCNFEAERDLGEIFLELDVEKIIRKLSIYKRKEIFKGDTLIIFDEIQTCPEAVTSLKYFAEQGKGYHVISLGSLLGVSVNRQKFSFPVGKVEFLNMFPMDFEEFLWASGEVELCDMIVDAYNSAKPLSEVFHKRALDLYKEFLFVGGMPEVVSLAVKTKNADIVRNKQNDILNAYLNDMSKYNKPSEISKVQMLYKNISTQLCKENKRFKYADVKTGGRASYFSTAIEWIELSGVAKRLFRLEQIKLPLNSYKSLEEFKFYFGDVGLCGAMENIRYNDIFENNPLMNDFKGGLAENYVFNQLISNGLTPFYWTSGNSAEIDFVVRLGDDIIPIEVKSGENVRARSLGVFNNIYLPKYALRISTKNFGFENNIKSIPLYAVFCVK